MEAVSTSEKSVYLYETGAISQQDSHALPLEPEISLRFLMMVPGNQWF
jgi:hypothetical protein